MHRTRQRLTGCSVIAVLALALLACKEEKQDSASAIAEVPRPAQPTGTPAPLESQPEAPLAASDSAAADSAAPDSAAPDAPAPRTAPPARSNPNHDGCRSSGQACTCSNTGWSGKCATGGAKSGLYCHCD
ncbi:MAG: hypothetical protein R3B07_36025 [Polyangiaceae bacterium]